MRSFSFLTSFKRENWHCIKGITVEKPIERLSGFRLMQALGICEKKSLSTGFYLQSTSNPERLLLYYLLLGKEPTRKAGLLWMLQKRMAHPLNMQNSRLEPLEIRLEKRIWALVCCQRDSLAKLKISVQVKEEKYCI